MLQRRDETYVCIRDLNDKKRFEKRFEKLFRKIRQEVLEARKEGFYKDGQKDWVARKREIDNQKLEGNA